MSCHRLISSLLCLAKLTAEKVRGGGGGGCVGNGPPVAPEVLHLSGSQEGERMLSGIREFSPFFTRR